jgi:type IV secretion system protein VirB1
VILPLAVFIRLAVACAPEVAPDTLAAVAQTESQRDALAIGDNSAHRSYRPATKADAIDVAQRLLAEGHDIDVGLMQINQKNFGWVGLTVADAFEPCRSLAAGAAVLTALSRYNTGSPSAGFANGYVARVAAAGRDIKLRGSGANNGVGDDEDWSPGTGEKRNEWNVFSDSDPSSQQGVVEAGDYHE